MIVADTQASTWTDTPAPTQLFFWKNMGNMGIFFGKIWAEYGRFWNFHGKIWQKYGKYGRFSTIFSIFSTIKMWFLKKKRTSKLEVDPLRGRRNIKSGSMRQINEQSERQIYLITKVRKMAKKNIFYTYWPRQKTFKLAIFLGPVIKHSRNEPQCGKSAKSDDFFSRNRPKTLTLAIFGALSPSYA